jgi:lipoprotein-anchoring transpeptidase ErfK/SrfK
MSQQMGRRHLVCGKARQAVSPCPAAGHARSQVDKDVSRSPIPVMRIVSRLTLVAASGLVLLLNGCAGGRMIVGKAYHVTAYRPHDPSAVRVKVSLSKQNIYVMEGDRCLMAVACSVGIPSKPTPRGSFTIYSKQEQKRSGSYGFSVQGDKVVPSTGGGPGRYVGYPMGYWCEFAPAYGFHQGFVHPNPRTHGCIRLHGEAAPKFFALVRIGTPVNIAETQAEDATIGPKVQRVDDSRAPDPDPRIMITSAAFEKPSGPLLE